VPDNPISTVFFDLDETLLQHTGSPRDLVFEIHAAHADAFDGIDAKTFSQTLWRKAHDMWHMMFDGVLPGTVARAYMFKNTLRELNADTDLAAVMIEEFEVGMLANTRPYPGAEDVLTALNDAGITTGIITNGYTHMQRRKIEHHNLHERVQHIFVSEAVGAHKPDHRIFMTALSKTNSQADQAMHVGDHLINDIQGALDAGMHAAYYNPSEEDVDHPEGAQRIRRLTQVLELVGLEEPSPATK